MKVLGNQPCVRSYTPLIIPIIPLRVQGPIERLEIKKILAYGKYCEECMRDTQISSRFKERKNEVFWNEN
jgi:hypothetical protein